MSMEASETDEREEDWVFTGVDNIAMDPPSESSVASTHGTSPGFDWPDEIAVSDMTAKRIVMEYALILMITRSLIADKKRSGLRQP